VIYDQRMQVLHSDTLGQTINAFRHDVLEDLMTQAFPADALPEQWQPEVLDQGLKMWFGLELPLTDWLKEADVGAQALQSKVQEAIDAAWVQKQQTLAPEVMASIEKSVLLQTLDRHWRHHLQALDFLRKGIGLRGYAQKDPLNEYGKESFVLFEEMMATIKRETVGMLARVQLVPEQSDAPQAVAQNTLKAAPAAKGAPVKKNGQAPDSQNPQAADPAALGLERWEDINPTDPRIPRNAPCPCGSTRRFKHCHGALER
jgi:preprotein translocase subunit SecA